jgi:hypothetical protein
MRVRTGANDPDQQSQGKKNHRLWVHSEPTYCRSLDNARHDKDQDLSDMGSHAFSMLRSEVHFVEMVWSEGNHGLRPLA